MFYTVNDSSKFVQNRPQVAQIGVEGGVSGGGGGATRASAVKVWTATYLPLELTCSAFVFRFKALAVTTPDGRCVRKPVVHGKNTRAGAREPRRAVSIAIKERAHSGLPQPGSTKLEMPYPYPRSDPHSVACLEPKTHVLCHTLPKRLGENFGWLGHRRSRKNRYALYC